MSTVDQAGPVTRGAGIAAALAGHGTASRSNSRAGHACHCALINRLFCALRSPPSAPATDAMTDSRDARSLCSQRYQICIEWSHALTFQDRSAGEAQVLLG